MMAASSVHVLSRRKGIDTVGGRCYARSAIGVYTCAQGRRTIEPPASSNLIDPGGFSMPSQPRGFFHVRSRPEVHLVWWPSLVIPRTGALYACRVQSRYERAAPRIHACGTSEADAAVIDAPCLVCHHSALSEECHWPRTRRYGAATVPMCVYCHTAQHSGNRYVIDTLIARAPEYWRSQGTWDLHEDEYETWMARRVYREAVV